MQYFFRYNGGIILKPTSALVKGNAAHSGCDYNYTWKAEKGTDAPIDEVLDAASDAFDKLAVDADFGDDSPGYLKDNTIQMVQFHMDNVAPRIMPVEVETWLDVEFDNRPYKLHQRCDIIDVEGRIIDHKFSGKKVSPESAEVDFQLSAYAYAFKVLYGEDPREVRLDRIVSMKTKTEYQPIPARRSQKDYDRMLHTLDAVASAASSGVFYPCDDTMTCGWCGYKQICWHLPYWEYVKTPELARDEARKLMARRLAVGTIIKEESTVDI